MPVPRTIDAGYRSPLMARIQGSGRLTLEDLRRDVPLYQAGRHAHLALQENPRHPDRDQLLRQKMVGEQAKERLVLAAIPLIKMLAHKEHRRRQNWHSQVTFEDLMQEGVSGFLRGLMAYNPEGGQKSPTNYLGQWIMTEMRRNTEGIDNDFGVAFDAAERFRRIRALRSRLAGDLGREPTDEEIIDASVNPAYSAGQKIGRLNKPAAPARQLTLSQLAEERLMRQRVGYTARLTQDGGEESSGPLVDFARPIDEDAGQAIEETVVERGAQQALANMLNQTLDVMRLPSVQRDIIARRYGLLPYRTEESARDISRALNVHRERVGKVLEAFSSEMTRPGGAFHRVCSQVSDEELTDLGLTWVINALGRYASTSATARTQTPPEILTAPLMSRARTSSTETPTTTSVAPVKAEFLCVVDGCRFLGLYLSVTEAPVSRACPVCQRPAERVRLMETASSAET